MIITGFIDSDGLTIAIINLIYDFWAEAVVFRLKTMFYKMRDRVMFF